MISDHRGGHIRNNIYLHRQEPTHGPSVALESEGDCDTTLPLDEQGAPCMIDLYGMDDKKLERSLRRLSYKKSWTTRLRVIHMAICATGGMLAAMIAIWINPTIIQRFSLNLIILIPLVFVFERYYARFQRRKLRATLAAMGRCSNCGYDLRGHNKGRCPECNEALPFGTETKS